MGEGIWSKMTGAFSRGEQSDKNEEAGEYQKNKTADSLRFAVYMPVSYEDAARSADAMKNGSGVVINGENMDNTGYQRVIDFLDGAAYVLGGAGRRISDTVRVYVPSSIDIVDETAPSYYGNLSAGKKRADV